MKFKRLKLLALVSTLTAAVSMSFAGLTQASTTSASSRSYGVDVSSYQPTSTTEYSKAGAQFVIVKVSEGTSYRNPNAKAQVASAKANKLLPMAYHFANFGSSSSRAKQTTLSPAPRQSACQQAHTWLVTGKPAAATQPAGAEVLIPAPSWPS